MIRQYREFFEKVFLTLLYLQYRKGTTPRDVVQNAVDYWHHPGSVGHFEGIEKVQRCAQHILENGHALGEGMYDEMIVELADQLLVDSEKGFKDGSLIDRLVRILGLPYARNTLNSRVLVDLRKALLLPDEMAQLGERLEQKEMRCAGCTHQFVNHEMVTVSKDGHDTLIHCMKCHRPSFVPCLKCDDRAVAVDKKLHKLLEQQWDCGYHDGVEKPDVTTGPAGPTLAQPGVFTQAAGQVFGGRTIARDRIQFTPATERYITWSPESFPPAAPSNIAHIDNIATPAHPEAVDNVDPPHRATWYDDEDEPERDNLTTPEPAPVDPMPETGETYTHYQARIQQMRNELSGIPGPTFIQENTPVHPETRSALDEYIARAGGRAEEARRLGESLAQYEIRLALRRER